ncbi:Polynucleotidyl transferase- ribonuclease H-like superfamily protein [Striga hermonthica]|uniref:Polynucleotidyl transferase- ribonuclease H-like superfamily protein n=1 Tax=Striga hermonthica TaxID=68872 RepID=A0A9N7R2L0_STRHE|nr:Polynucleotidyl transferase- ribonuclease H-like superfamily protein [Striga hermonthica]
MLAKYQTAFSNTASTTQCSHGSPLAKALCKVWPEVVKQVRWSLGNGEKCRFWLDPWLGSIGPLIHLVSHQPSVSNIQAPVAEFIDDIGNWKWDSFHGYLPSTVVMRIARTFPPRPTAGPDRIMWAPSQNGQFSTSTAYQALNPSDRPPEAPLWKSIWRVQAPQRVRTFLWLAAKERLLTNEDRVRRHISGSDLCEECGEKETVLHVLRDCKCTKSLWKQLIPAGQLDDFFLLPLQQWLRRNLLMAKLGTVLDWGSLFAFTLWSSWHCRNNRIFNNRTLSGVNRRQQVLSLMESYARACTAYRRVGATMYEVRLIHWSYPEPGWIKVNTDGSYDGNTALMGVGPAPFGPNDRAPQAQIRGN